MFYTYKNEKQALNHGLVLEKVSHWIQSKSLAKIKHEYRAKKKITKWI